eukprot:376345_1
MSVILLIYTIAYATLMSTTLSFSALLSALDSCPQYDIIQNYRYLETLNEEKQKDNSFENQMSAEEFALITRQISPGKYLTKSTMSLVNNPQRISKHIAWLRDNYPIEFYEYTLEIGMAEPEITPLNIVGQSCRMSDKIHGKNDVSDRIAGKILRYDAKTNQHLIDLGYTKKWIFVSSKRKHEQLDIINKVEKHKAIHPKTWIYFLDAVGLLFPNETNKMGPVWAQFWNSLYGSRPDLKRGLNFDIFCVEKCECENV